METRHINYKSDFVIRERFRDGTGKVVALPDVDFELRYWVGSKTVTASRKNGVFANCVADGDALLVIFKDHGLARASCTMSCTWLWTMPYLRAACKTCITPKACTYGCGTRWATRRA